jgi:hypothetical protein
VVGGAIGFGVFHYKTSGSMLKWHRSDGQNELPMVYDRPEVIGCC